MHLPQQRQNILESSFDSFNKIREAAGPGWILLNPTSLGDTMIVCALAKAFKEKHGGPLTMVVSETQLPLAHMYKPAIDRILVASFDELHTLSFHLVDSQVFCKNQPYVVHPFWHGDGRWECFFELFRYPKRGGLSLPDIFRYILRLDWDASFEMPFIHNEWRAEAEKVAIENGFAPGQSVLLFPDNNSNPTFPDRFWEMLADEFTKNGRKVFTNLAGNRKGSRKEPIRNTQAINIPLHLVIPLAEIAGRYVTGANGLACTLDIAKVRSEGTVLLYNGTYKLNSYEVKDPVLIQSARYHGLSDRLIPEYLVDPNNYDALVPDIAVNNPKTALVW